MLTSVVLLMRLLVRGFFIAVGPLVAAAAVLARLLHAAAGTGFVADSGAATLAAATLALIAVLAVAITLARAPVRVVDASAPHPRRAIHDATRLTETHPDAPGHSRSRAPGFAALAA